MAQRKNIGKVVVSLEGRQQAPMGQSERGLIRADGAYLVTGGLGAIGSKLAQWLADQGAGEILLLSRHHSSDKTQPAVVELRRAGANIVLLQGDVADVASLRQALAAPRDTALPLRGVFHAAGVLDDGVMFDMDLERLDRPMAPKVQGAWNLHAATLDAELDLFVLFSSVACVLGSPGQANYAAGNAFLDALAAYRTRRGLPATCVNWGPWAESGMAAEAGRDTQLAARGMDVLPADACLRVLDSLVRAGRTQTAVMAVRWRDMLKQSSSIPPLLRDLAPTESIASEEDPEAAALRAKLAAADIETRTALLVEYFQDQLATIMGLTSDSIDATAPLNTLGLDSLMAIELKNKIESRLAITLPMARFMEGPSVTTLAQAAADLIGVAPADRARPSEETAVRDVETNASADDASAGRFPLTHGQQALWFIQRLAPESSAYNLADAIRILGPLNIDAMRQAMQTLIDRHSLFRTTIHDDDGAPYQVVHNSAPAPFFFEDATAWTAEQLASRLHDEAHRPFNLEQGPLGRLVVLKEAEDRHLLIFVVHHIIADMMTMVACAGELKQLYTAALVGQSIALPRPAVEFGEFARRHREMLASEYGERHWQYWRRELDGELPVLDLPTDKPRPKVQTYNGELLVRVVGKALAQKVQQLAQRRGATLNMVLLAAYKLLLSRYSGQDEVLVGIPASGRTRSELKNAMGYFVNPVVIRGDLSANPTAGEFIDQVRSRMVGALDHQDYPFPLLVERLAPERDSSRPPVFQTMFSMQQFHVAKKEGLTPFLAGESNQGLDVLGLRFEPAGLAQRITQFDLALTSSEGDDDGIALAMQYNTDLFHRETVERMLAHFENLLRSMVENDQSPVAELSILSPDERQSMLVGWNQTQRDYRKDVCVHQLFEAQVERTPETVAVYSLRERDGGSLAEQVTYGELNRRANRLAHHLRNLGVKPESTVGLCLERSAEMLVAVLGVLKAGGSYVPIDPDLPTERKQFLLADAGIQVLVTEACYSSGFGEFAGMMIRLDADAATIALGDESNPTPLATPSNRAYVIYTSGSTGQPKGVEIEHASIVNYTQCAAEQFRLTPADRVLQFASLSFDTSAEEIFPTLATGGTLVMRDASMSLAPAEFLAECGRRGVTVLDLPTAYWRQLTREAASQTLSLPGSIRLVIIGGERAAPEDVAVWQQLFGEGATLMNGYGPTEVTIVATFWTAPTQGPITSAETPIGRPIANAQAYVLDRQMQPVPIGVAGELYIGGAGLARGYLNRPELTTQRFVPNPFRAGERLYMTGDMVRFLPDGNLEYLNRADNQVKVRGFRVELGEIEAALTSHEQVRQCVVHPWSDPSGQTRLAAYLVCDGEVPDANALRSFLSRTLPDYMIPADFVSLPAIPLSRNNKLDRKALPEPTVAQQGLKLGFVAPRNEMELELAAIWEEVLGVSPIGVRDNFFDLGGHSLLAVQLVSRVGRRFQCSVPLAALLSDGTIERLAVFIGQAANDRPWSPLTPIRPHGALAPLFCVHPAGGNVLGYYELAQHVDPERPVYALQARGVDGKLPPHVTLDEMAEEYLAAIRSVQPAGPYHVVGWSSGGVVAYEIARRLSASGETIGVVSLIDSRVMSSLDFDPDDESRILVTLADFLQRFYGFHVPVTYEELEQLDREARLAHVLERAKVAGQVPLELDVEQLRVFLNVARANLKVLKDYAPPKSELPVHLYRAAQRVGEQDSDLSDDLGWRKIVGDALVVHEVPGDHITMMAGANAERLAAELESALALQAASPQAVRSDDAASVAPTAPADELRPFYENVQAHYDRSNAFYRIFLDPTMTYSCAYFERDDMSLQEAQLAKIDLSLGKCQIEPGMRLLDVGCGWGATGLRAAEKYGARVIGLTLSTNQHAYASRLAQGRENVEFRVQGWEEFREPVDRIVSVGALEHFRVERYGAFFRRCREVLPSDGRMMIHSILKGDETTIRPGVAIVDDELLAWAKLMTSFIFPGGELPTRALVRERAEPEGFRLVHTQSLRLHYARTLDLWRRSLEAARQEAIALTDEETYHKYIDYLTGSAHYFRTGHLDVVQFTFQVQ